MKVQFIGSAGDPDEIKMHGFTFERKGEPVEIPDDHPRARQFIENQHFKVQHAPKEIAPPADLGGDDSEEPAPKQPRAPRAVPKAKPGKPGPKAKAIPQAGPADEPKMGDDPDPV